MTFSEITSSNIFNKNIIKCNFTPIPESKISCKFFANCVNNNSSNIIISASIYCNMGGKHKIVESKSEYLHVSSSEQEYCVVLDIPNFTGNYESFIQIRVNSTEDADMVVNIKNLRVSRVELMKCNEDIPNIIFDENNIINIYPFVVKESGYGILVDNIFENLPKFGYTVINMGTDNHVTNSTNISIFITLPTSFFKTSSKFNIGYTMFEATKIPPIWIDYCNKMDRLFVPCNANIKAFRASGVKIPIDIIPIGVDTKLYNPELYEPTYNFGMPQFEKTYKFLILNDGQPRKNNQMVFKAFSEEFHREIASNEVCLVLRQHNPYTERNIIYIKEYLEDKKLASLIRSCDSMISASSGEAGDIPILTGMSMGKPVIVTKEFAHPDYVEDNKTGYFIDTESIVPAYTQPEYKDDIGIIKGAEWISPSFTSLKEKMRYVYENRDEAENVGRNARKFIVENRDNTVCIGKMVKVFKKLTG